jgi:hypothetical protein
MNAKESITAMPTQLAQIHLDLIAVPVNQDSLETAQVVQTTVHSRNVKHMRVVSTWM